MENQYKHETTKFLVLTIAQIIALTVMIITAAAPFVLYQQQSLAQQEQREQQHSLSSQTTFDIEDPLKIYPLR